MEFVHVVQRTCLDSCQDDELDFRYDLEHMMAIPGSFIFDILVELLEQRRKPDRSLTLWVGSIDSVRPETSNICDLVRFHLNGHKLFDIVQKLTCDNAIHSYQCLGTVQIIYDYMTPSHDLQTGGYLEYAQQRLTEFNKTIFENDIQDDSENDRTHPCDYFKLIEGIKDFENYEVDDCLLISHVSSTSLQKRLMDHPHKTF